MSIESARITPDLVDSFSPTLDLKVFYSKGGEVKFGNEMTPADTGDFPLVQWSGKDTKDVDKTHLFTLVMVDPDAPGGHWLHWIQMNIKGSQAGRDGDTITFYAGPTPPKGTGVHRYVFLLFKQHGKLDQATIKARNKFHVREFMKKHHLGDPVGCNWFSARHEKEGPTV